jgi:acyl-CoA synthetase (AMP-forming)/AMP-acid ligase II
MAKTAVVVRAASRIGREPGSSPWNNVVSFLELHRENCPDHPALIWASRPASSGLERPLRPVHEKLSFGELAARSESVAAGLAAMGLRAKDRVFLFVPMSPSLYIAMLAVQRLGAVALFLDSWARRSELEKCIAHISPRCFIGSEAALRLIHGGSSFASIEITLGIESARDPHVPTLESLACAGDSLPIASVASEDTALVTYTTGSSGNSRGANRTHRFLAAQHAALASCIPYESSDVDLPVFPIFSLNNLAGGVTTVLPDIDLAQPSKTDGDVLLDQMLAANVSTCTLSPSLLRAAACAARRRNVTLGSLRRCATGGAPITPEDVVACTSMAPAAQVCILYGSTEVEPIAHITYSAAQPQLNGDAVCVGRIAHGLECKLIRLTREPIWLTDRGWSEWEVPTGMPGELVVCGEHVCEGYYRDPDAFLQAKIRDPNGCVWHRTGDVCRADPQGRIWIVGRVHNAICRAGQVLFPVGPEMVMKRLPFVAAAAYVGLPDAALGERTCAAFSVHSQQSAREQMAAVRDALEAEHIPVDEVRCVHEIPLDPRHHSKVQYALLRDQLLSEDGLR